MLPSESKHGQPPLLPSITIPDLTHRIIRLENQYCDAGGSFGDVFRCRYAGDDGIKEVAVKAFRFNFTVDERDRDRKKVARMIRRELGIWSRLSHRNIVPFLGIVHGFGRQGNTSLVSLWMPHGTLHTFLEAHGNRLAVAHRLQLLLDIANGLQYLHSFSIVHGDLTSNNVLLDHNYNACLTDFGCAFLVGKLPEGFTFLQASTRRPGTLRWAAPEHFSTDETGAEHTIKSDIYSFGNMALLVLSGKYPWSEVRADAAVMLQLSLGHEPARPLVLPIDDQYWAFIKRCWSAIPDRPLAEEVVSSLQQFMGAFPPPATIRDLLDAPTPSSSVLLCPRNDDPDNVMQIGSPPNRSQPCNATDSRASASPPASESITRDPDVLASSPDHVPRSSPEALTVDTQHLSSRIHHPLAENTCHRDQDSSVASSDSPQSSKWVLGTLLGIGTYGRVYLALDQSTGGMIAVKQVEKRNNTQGLNSVFLLRKEQQILQGLDHPNIVAYLGSEETPTHLSISMEYVPGNSIGKCLREYGRFNEEMIKSFMVQILEGLAYLHANGIIHRNIEANNILIDSSGVCRISGFGNAQRADDDGASWIPMRGVVFWTAPETIESHGEKRYGPKVDIWSAGCVLLGMWTGGIRADDVFASIVTRGVRSGSGLESGVMRQGTRREPWTSLLLAWGMTLSDLARDFCDRCFALDPEARASAAELVRHPYLTPEPDWVFTGFE